MVKYNISVEFPDIRSVKWDFYSPCFAEVADILQNILETASFLSSYETSFKYYLQSIQ